MQTNKNVWFNTGKTIESILDEAQMLDPQDKDFKSPILICSKSLKKHDYAAEV